MINDYIVMSDRGGMHVCITLKEAESVVEALDKQGIYAAIYKRM